MIRNASRTSLLVTSLSRAQCVVIPLSRAAFYSTTVTTQPKLITPYTRRTTEHGKHKTSSTFRPLDPYVLSKRLTRLCVDGKILDAISMLKSTPRDAQNVVVWNTVILECMKVQKYKAAYELFTDMKRRGFSPNFATYATMLNGFSRITNWEVRTLQLEQAHNLFEAVTAYVENVGDAPSQALNSAPVTSYLRILGNANLYDKLFETFHSLPTTGPLAPTVHSYTAIFRSLVNRPVESQESLHDRQARNASDARFLWGNLVRSAGGQENLAVDAMLIETVVRTLMFGKQADHALALQIIRDFVGLETSLRPDVTNKSISSPAAKFPISTQLLQTLLEFCNVTRRYTLSSHWLRLVMEKRVEITQEPIPDRGHIQQGLLAHAGGAAIASRSSSAPSDHARQAAGLLEYLIQEYTIRNVRELEVKPGAFELVIATCMFTKDWTTAKHVFKLMTGYDLVAFADERTGLPQREVWPNRRSMAPGTIIMGYLTQLAAEVGDPVIMRQCARALLFFGSEKLLSDYTSGSAYRIYVPFYRLKMADAVLLLNRSKEGWVGELDERSRGEWEGLVSAAKITRSHVKKDVENANSGIPLALPPIEKLSLYAERSRQRALTGMIQHRQRDPESSWAKRPKRGNPDPSSQTKPQDQRSPDSSTKTEERGLFFEDQPKSAQSEGF